MAANLANRVKALEDQVADLRKLLERKAADATPPVKDWKRTIGMFKDDPLFDEIVELGAAYRRRQPKC